MKLDISIPTKLNEISLGTYQTFMKVSEKTNDDEFLCEKMVQIFCHIELKDVAEIRWSDVQYIIDKINTAFQDKPKFKRTFKINTTEFGFIPDLEDISFGEFVDLQNNLDKIEDFHKAMAVMYRPIIEKKGDKYEIERYQSAHNYAEVMQHAPIDIALAAKVFFLRFVKRIVEQYPVVFKDGSDEGQEDANSFSARAQFGERWGWYSTIYAIANGDLTKFDRVTTLSLRKCLTWLAFEKQKRDIENGEMQRQLNKIKR